MATSIFAPSTFRWTQLRPPWRTSSPRGYLHLSTKSVWVNWRTYQVHLCHLTFNASHVIHKLLICCFYGLLLLLFTNLYIHCKVQNASINCQNSVISTGARGISKPMSATCMNMEGGLFTLFCCCLFCCLLEKMQIIWLILFFLLFFSLPNLDRSCRLLALRLMLNKLNPVNFDVLKFVFQHFVKWVFFLNLEILEYIM